MIIQQIEPITLATAHGPMRTEVWQPAPGGKYPGLVFFSEIFQITPPIRRTAALLAGHGYVVAVPEIYHELEPAGTVLPYDQAGAERGNAHKIAKALDSYDADARAVLDYLATHPACTGKLGAIGVCIGGHLAFRAAMNRDVLAAACFYPTDLHKHGLGRGMKDDSLARVKEISGELLMIWGRQDPHVPREGRALIYNALSDANVRFTWHQLNAQHAFVRDEGPRYDPVASLQSYQLAAELFHRRLAEGDRFSQESKPAESRH